jgi:hypothetical protein
LAYFLGLLLYFLPLGEIVTSAWPWLWGEPLWRFSVGGMGGASSATMLVGLSLILVVAIGVGDKAFMWLVAILTAVTAFLYGVGGALFFLDAVQLKGGVSTQDPGRYKVTAAWIMVKIALSAFAFAWVSAAAIKSVRIRSREASRDLATDKSILVR